MDFACAFVAGQSKKMIAQKAKWMKRLAHDYFKSYTHLKEMTFADRRALLQNLFSGKTDDGERFDVYVTRTEKHFGYSIKGNFNGLFDIKPRPVGPCVLNVGGRIGGDRVEERPLRNGALMFRCDPGRTSKTGISVTFRQSSDIDKP